MDILRSQICPNGGLRSHCPLGNSCLMRHRDDKWMDIHQQDEEYYQNKLDEMKRKLSPVIGKKSYETRRKTNLRKAECLRDDENSCNIT